jgi:hypothetical protein
LPEIPPRPSGSDAEPQSRARLLYTVGALATFAGLVVIVLAATGGGADPPAAAPAPEACLEQWNEDEDALADGRHASAFHGYSRTQVAYVSEEGEVLDDRPAAGAGCAVIFASNGLDSEPEFAVRVRRDGTWGGLHTVLDASRLAALQAGAFDGANAQVQQDGRLTPAS